MNIVREKNLGPEVVYSLTDKGRRLSSYFGLDEGQFNIGVEYFELIKILVLLVGNWQESVVFFKREVSCLILQKT